MVPYGYSGPTLASPSNDPITMPYTFMVEDDGAQGVAALAGGDGKRRSGLQADNGERIAGIGAKELYGKLVVADLRAARQGRQGHGLPGADAVARVRGEELQGKSPEGTDFCGLTRGIIHHHRR